MVLVVVAMTFIDQTVVSIAVPQVHSELGLSNTGVQWAVTAYLLVLGALFACGGRLADTVGHRRVVAHGVRVGLRRGRAGSQAHSPAPSHSASGGRSAANPHFVRLDFAYATRTVFYVMAAIMAAAAVVAWFGLQKGLQAEHPDGAASEGPDRGPDMNKPGTNGPGTNGPGTTAWSSRLSGSFRTVGTGAARTSGCAPPFFADRVHMGG
jgi:hypothetical protein